MVERVLGVEHGVARLQRPDSGDLVGDGPAPGVGLAEEGLQPHELVAEPVDVGVHPHQRPGLAHGHLLQPPDQRPDDRLRHYILATRLANSSSSAAAGVAGYPAFQKRR